MTTSGVTGFNLSLVDTPLQKVSGKSFYVYAHTKPDNTIFYVGKGTRNRAWSAHNRNTYWNNVVQKHGYKVVILANLLTERQAIDEEEKIIAHFKKFNCLTNILDRGDIAPSSQPDVAKKISKSLQGIVRSEETKKKLRAIIRGPEWRAKISKAALGRKISEETRQKMKASNSGRKHSEATKQKIRENAIARGARVPYTPEVLAKAKENHPFRGKKRPEVSAMLKARGSFAGKNNPWFGTGYRQIGAKNHMARKVIGSHPLHGEKTWDTLKETADCLGVSIQAIYQAIKKSQKSKGWKLEYLS